METTRTAEIAAARAADEQIAAAWDLYWTAVAPITETAAELRRHAKMVRYHRPEEHAARTAKLEARKAELQAIAEPLAAAAEQLDRELYTGWTRFYLVEHIHNSRHCSSFRPTTRVGWLPSVSGLTSVEAVAEYGAILCTKCFPDAPVEHTAGKDDGKCAGSGASIDRSLGGRHGFYSGNSAVCPVCGKRVSYRNGGYAVPKHDAAVAA